MSFSFNWFIWDKTWFEIPKSEPRRGCNIFKKAKQIKVPQITKCIMCIKKYTPIIFCLTSSHQQLLVSRHTAQRSLLIKSIDISDNTIQGGILYVSTFFSEISLKCVKLTCTAGATDLHSPSSSYLQVCWCYEPLTWRLFLSLISCCIYCMYRTFSLLK